MSAGSWSIILHWIKYSNFKNMSKRSIAKDTKSVFPIVTKSSFVKKGIRKPNS
jgi:hypothetical protein